MNKRYSLFVCLLLAACAPAWGQKLIVREASPQADLARSFHLVNDSSAEAENNSTKIQAQLDGDKPTVPWFVPGTEDNFGPFRFARTIILPTDWGRKWIGNGKVKHGDAGGGYGSQLLMRYDDNKTVFDGTTNKLTTSAGGATVLVTGRATHATDRFNSIEITGGTGMTTGWYTIISVSVGASGVGTWTLDRDCCEAAVSNGAGVYCPELMQNRGGGTYYEGINFQGRRTSSDTRGAFIGFHQITYDQAEMVDHGTDGVNPATNTGNHTFINCTFDSFNHAILCGGGLAEWGDYDGEWYGREDNHCDNLTTFGTWAGNVEQFLTVRSQQSVVHNHYALRVAQLSGSVFHFDTGGKLFASGLEVSGNFSGLPTRILYLGPKAGGNYSPYNVENVSFDGASTPNTNHASRNPQLVVTEWDDVNSSAMITFRGVRLPGIHEFSDDMPLVDVQSAVTLTLENVENIKPDSIRVRAGANGTWKPFVLLIGCSLGVSNPEDIIDEANCDAGCVIQFVGCTDGAGGTIWNETYTTVGP